MAAYARRRVWAFGEMSIACVNGVDRIKAFEEIALGEGRLVIHNGKQIAAYRDEKGELFLLSPICTHMGCHVLWNDVEQTWDCPCHGGRYSPTGERLYGPPPEDLVPLYEKIEAH